LAHGPLWRSELEIPDRAIVEDRISGDMVECSGLGDMATATPDDCDKFPFVVERFRHTRSHDRRTVSDEARREPAKQRGVVRLLNTAFGRVVRVVQSNTDDFAW